ncbi:hypothetical protein [Clostridium tarantellae]|uniref:Uncharacterized protein n=1 Tax=Clostridium tarantellae TaxID=39493 RepID=A0A6I1MQU6_9CLOT|nr:hypothetical protein [Clostridium tarantellae]MPQ45173.1 hypothetical protein [Clostridium tarantellae]
MNFKGIFFSSIMLWFIFILLSIMFLNLFLVFIGIPISILTSILIYKKQIISFNKLNKILYFLVPTIAWFTGMSLYR